MIRSKDKKFNFEEGAVIEHDLDKAPKTGDWRYMMPKVDKEKCSGCTTCVPFCPEASIEMKKYKEGQRDKADIDYDFCKGCGVCAQVCPMKAITMEKNK
ncbi:MAG: 4Fe-4S binding protein [Candidatus Moranbacteria bacterium]|nr:4Fe-4S binding protein [bacterium]MDP1833509.1 4Fe-4S binding protein [Candidatus Moranbacteria bacterium]MDZ4385405.1 4Fe-4S binding protein [Candidatus Moranbacteria bacterium]